MSRNFKNVIMIILIIVGIICIYFTTSKSVGNPPERPQNINDQKMIENGNDFRKDIGEVKGDSFENGIKKDYRNSKNEDFEREKKNIKIDKKYVIEFAVEALIISLIFSYLVISNFNEKGFKESFENIDKIIIYILITIISIGLIISVVNYFVTNRKEKDFKVPMENEQTEKTTFAKDIEEGNVIIEKNINLSDYTSNITIKDGGEYNLIGNFEYSVLIKSKEKVILNLNNVNIKNELTATIANISTNELEINLVENSNNVLSDGGASEYDACIYSEGPLEISGTGNLEVYGNQVEGEGIATETNNITINGGKLYIQSKDDGINAGGDGGKITINNGTIFINASGDGIDSNKNLVINGGTIYTIGSPLGGDAGIDTDDGFDINGGLVIALGSDMLEAPNSTSKQNSLCVTLEKEIEKGTLITLINDNDEIIVSFNSEENFKTLIISSKELKSGKYYLYKNGKNTGKLENGIYYSGEYTKGEEITTKNSREFQI